MYDQRYGAEKPSRFRSQYLRPANDGQFPTVANETRSVAERPAARTSIMTARFSLSRSVGGEAARFLFGLLPLGAEKHACVDRDLAALAYERLDDSIQFTGKSRRHAAFDVDARQRFVVPQRLLFRCVESTPDVIAEFAEVGQ